MFDCIQQDDYCLREVVVHVASYHADRSKVHNEVNPGLGLRFKNPSSRWFAAAGVYENSIYRTSFYAGMGTDVPLIDHVALRFTVVVVSGYEAPLMPVLVPELVIERRGYGVAIGFVPKLKSGNHEVQSVMSFSLIKRF